MPRLQLAKVGLYNRTMRVTKEALDQMVETAKDDIPVIVSHYEMGEYAGGWVRHESLKTEEIDGEYSLTGQVDYLDGLKHAIDNEYLKHWSILALPTEEDGAYKLFHLAYLGNSLPAIAGLKKLDDAVISASKSVDRNMDGALICEYSINTKNGENMEKVKELEGKVEDLKLELSKVKDNGEKKALELTKEVESLKESNEALELDNKNMKAKIEEYNSKKFNDLMLQLEEAGKGRMIAEDLKDLIAEYKEQGISCQKEVERQIRIFSKVSTIVPGNGSLVRNEDPEVTGKREQAEKDARNPKGM